MNGKLIYVSSIRLTDKVSRDWYVSYSIEKGAVVEYWDIVSLVREEHVEAGALAPSYLQYIKTYKEFDGSLRLPENEGAVYVMLISYSARTSKPFRLLSQYNCKMVFLNWGAMPTTAPVPRWQRIIYRFLSNPVKFASTVFDITLGTAYRKFNVVKRYDMVFAAGQALTSVDQYAKRVVPFNLCDFDHYKRVDVAGERIIQGKYAVFLDQYLPHHSDLEAFGLPAVTADSYFQSLNRFFDLLDKTHGIKVVIAAHPKANYDNDTFKQRETYRLLTAELVKDAEFVIMHTSTALSYAVLNLKPVIFIYTAEMMRVYAHTIIRQIKSLASYLDADIFDVDQITDGSQVIIQPASRERYDSYKYSYLTSPESENFSSAEIFWREINAI